MISVLVALVALAAPDIKVDKVDSIDGEWQVVGGTVNGNPIPEQLASGMRFIFKNGTLTALIRVDNNQEALEKTQKCTYKLDALKQPPEIDITPVDGPEKDKTTQGIFNIKGDELKLCMGKAGAARPKKFEADDAAVATLIFKRVKK